MGKDYQKCLQKEYVLVLFSTFWLYLKNFTISYHSDAQILCSILQILILIETISWIMYRTVEIVKMALFEHFWLLLVLKMLSGNSTNMRSLKLHNKGVYCKGRYHKSQNYYTVLGSKRVDFWFLKMGRWGSLPRCFQFWSKMVQMGPTYLGLMGFCWNLSWPVLTFPANCEWCVCKEDKYFSISFV